MDQAKILIVDDNPENLTSLIMLFKKIDVNVIAVEDGNKALAEALNQDFALIILDVQMPNMDGYEVAKLLHGDIKTKDIPVVFITAAYSDEEHLLEGYKNGAVDYIEKPIHDTVLLSKVAIFIRLWKQQRALEREVLLRAQANKEIKHLATHDHLTGIANRVLLTDLIGKAFARAKRYELKLAILFLDLDGFKSINDAYGHDAGDYLLKVYSQRLTSSVRAIDSVIRFGGDEFIILLTDLQDRGEALTSANRISDALAKPLNWKGHNLLITASIGIACYPENGTTEAQLIQKADNAMYQVKSKNKNNIAFYNEI